MTEFFIAAVAAFVVFAVLGLVYFVKRRSDAGSPRYVCTHCGEMDCICHLEENSR